MKCPKCQYENREGAIYCLKCGNKLEIKCPKCTHSLPPEALFCDKCGFNLKESLEPSTIDYEKPRSYTPKYLADKILTTRSSLEGERKIVTVLFADVANYTSMSEKLDPEEVLQIMDGAFKIMMDETHKYEGTINQFTGDGIMAIFGAPVAHENHAQRTCYTALSIQNAMSDYSAKIEKDYGLDFKIRIGINTGPVIVTAIGDDLRMDYTAVGDTTNLASRMESQAKPGSIFVSGNSHKITERYFEFKYIGKTDVKGKKETQDIYELIKTSDVVTRIDESVAKGLTRFVGRKNSIAALKEAYDLVKSGAGQVVGVVGEAGVGKTRLVLEMRNRLPENEYTYLEGQCLQYGGSILYMPILDILRSFFNIKDNDREFVINKKIKDKVLAYSNLDHTPPVFQNLLSVKMDDETFLKLEPMQKREKTFESIRDLLITVSQEKPFVMIIEDLHWIDDTSEEFLDYLIEWIANTPIMLILLYRTEYHHKWGSKTYYRKIGLDHLRKDSSIELVNAMLEGGEVAPELRDLILARAAGNPLFMEELTQTLIENGTIKKEANQYVLSRNISDVQVPETVQGIIAARMDRLEDNLKRTMQVASVIGRDFAFSILQTISGMREELKSYLRNLQGLEFIYEKNLFPELEYIFKHALTQEVAYNSLLVKRRKQIHENIGNAIEEIYTKRLEDFYEMLAYHYSKSDNFEKAFQYLKLSGEKAFRNYANEEAFKFYKEALYVLKRLPDTEKNKETQIETSLLAYSPMALIGFPEGSMEILEDGERLCKVLGDKVSLASVYSYICRYYVYTGNPLDGVKYIEPRFYESQRVQDVELMVPLSVSLCISNIASGCHFKTRDFVPEVIDLLEKTKRKSGFFNQPFNAYSYLCSMHGLSLIHIGSFEDGLVFIEYGLNYAWKINSAIDIGTGESQYGTYYLQKGNGKQAIKHFQNSIKYYEEGNFLYAMGWVWSSLGHAYHLIGDLEKAKKNIEKGFNIHKRTPVKYLLDMHLLHLGMLYYDLGETKECIKSLKKSLEFSKRINNYSVEGFSRIWLGRILGGKINTKRKEAEANILQGIRILEELKLKVWLSQGHFFLGELYANIDRKNDALINLNKALSMCQEMGIGYWPDKIQEVLDRL